MRRDLTRCLAATRWLSKYIPTHFHTLLLVFELLYLVQFLAFFILHVIFIHTCLPSIGDQCCTEQASLDVVGFP
jgi:hypothetical protein